MEFDINEFELQRYDNIKQSGNYLEVNILIGCEKDIIQGHTGNVPVVRTTMHNCGPEEVANLYASLQGLMTQLEKDYPLACLYAKTAMKVTAVKTTEVPVEDEKPKKEE